MLNVVQAPRSCRAIVGEDGWSATPEFSRACSLGAMGLASPLRVIAGRLLSIEASKEPEVGNG